MGCVTSFLLFSVHLVCFLPRIFYAGLMPSPVLTRGWYEYILDVAFFLSTHNVEDVDHPNPKSIRTI